MEPDGKTRVIEALQNLLPCSEGCDTEIAFNEPEDNEALINELINAIENPVLDDNDGFPYLYSGLCFRSIEELVWNLVDDVCGENTAGDAKAGVDDSYLDNVRDKVDKLLMALKEM